MSNGIGHNNLNDISKIYLDTISDINKKDQDADVERWQNEAVKGEDTQRRKDDAADRKAGKGKLLSKKAGESYAKWTMRKHPMEDVSDSKYQREGKLTSVKATTYGMPAKERQVLIDKERERLGVKSKPTKEEFSNWREDAQSDALAQMMGDGGDPQEDAIKQVVRAEKKAAKKKKVKKEEFSNWRNDLREVVSDDIVTKDQNDEKVKEKKVKNKIIINPQFKEAVKEMGGELLEVKEVDSPDNETKDDAKSKDKEKRLKLRLLRLKMMATKQGADSTIVTHYEPEIEGAVEYFYENGINAEGLEQIIEEVGLDDFLEFVLDDNSELLAEERKARKMNVRTLKATQKKAAEIKASKKDVVARGTPKDTVARARAERSTKKPKLAKPSAPKKEAPKAKPAVVKKVATVKPVAKKVVKSVAKVKKTQPAKKPDKGSLRDRIGSAVKAGTKRHRKATQPLRILHKGMKSGARKVLKVAKDVRSVTTANKSKTVNMQSYEPEGDTLSEVKVTKIGDEQQKAMADAVLKRKEDLKKKEKAKCEEVEVQERTLDTFEKGEKERIVKGMKKDTKDLKKRYGKKWKNVMYATATKKAKEEGDTSKSDKRYAYEETDRAFANVVASLRAKHGKDAVLTKDSPKPKPQPRQKPKPDTRTDAQKKADQYTANMDAVYGGKQRDRGLGT